MELFLDVLGETLVDTAKMLPFLFLAYLLIEYIEHRHGERIEALLAGGGRWGAVPGAVLGCVPQCGFSAIASNFYASRVITLGTLMAVYLATSDEAIPLLVSMPTPCGSLERLFMELFLDVLGETLVDTAKMLPFLFLAYLLIEYIEHRHGERIEALLAGGGRWGAVPGAVLGCVPQCGFSAIASNFYASRVITLGTLMAVYLATSDEAIPLLVSMPAYWDKLAVLMVIKVVYAIVVGFVLDFVLRGVLPKGLRGGYTGHADEVDCHEEHSDAEGNEKPIWQAALRHTLEIFVFIFAFSLVFGMIVEGVGEDVFAEVLGGMGFFQPVVAALVGLIPNCAASVLLTQLYVEGALRFSSLVAGLCTGAGVGLAVLWRANPSWKQNLFITGLTWAAGAFVGVAMQVIVAVFA